MAGIEKIKEKILSDSEEKVASVIASANAQADEITKKANANAASKAEELKRKAEYEANEKKRILSSMAELETRNEILNAKQEIIEKAFNSALEKLSSIEFEQYKNILREMMLKAVETGEEEVILSAKDRTRLTESFISEINMLLGKEGKTGSLTLSMETANISGGFLLRSKGVEINNSFEALVRMHRDEIEPKIAEVLF